MKTDVPITTNIQLDDEMKCIRSIEDKDTAESQTKRTTSTPTAVDETNSSSPIRFNATIRIPSSISVASYDPSFNKDEALKTVDILYNSYIADQAKRRDASKHIVEEIRRKRRSMNMTAKNGSVSVTIGCDSTR